MLDATAVLAVLSVVGSVTVFSVLGYRISRLIKTCNSEDV